MDLKDVKSMKWTRVPDWRGLSASCAYSFGVFVTKIDIDNFVESIFWDVARRLNIPYTELEPILKEENSDFYVSKERLFDNHSIGVKKDDLTLLKTQRMLKIPDVTILGYDDDRTEVERILEAFAALSDIEKLQVLERLGTVKVEYQSE